MSITYIFQIKKALSNDKAFVLKAGLEPARPKRSLDFKSNVSTNSTTSASWYIFKKVSERKTGFEPATLTLAR